MNEGHAKLCSSPEWARHMQVDVLPSLIAGVDLGDDMLEVGPGPGATTDWLRHRVTRLVAVEFDGAAADKLRARFLGTNVVSVSGDATDMSAADASFDSVGCFTMLHHVPTLALQNKLLSEVLRVLRPGGVLVGSDSLASDELHEFHEGDTYNPVEPASFLVRLQTLGYQNVTLTVGDELRFVAYSP